ncbi:MAG: VOC family protein [Gemmatimonadota bacterium]
MFVKDVQRLARFYKEVIEMAEVHGDKDHVVLDAGGFQLVLHGIPTTIAAALTITDPPLVRADMPIKICLPVESIARARARAAELGGNVGPQGTEWQARGCTACDGFDPEGNVFQVRERAV